MSYPQKPPKLNHPGSLDIHIMYKQKTRKAEALRELLYLYNYLSVSCLTLWLRPVAAQPDTMPTAAALSQSCAG